MFPYLNLQRQELKKLRDKTPKDLWNDDVDVFMEELDVSSVQIPCCATTLYVFVSVSV